MAGGTPSPGQERHPAAPTCSHAHEKKGIPQKVQERFTLRATARTAGPDPIPGATVGNPPITLHWSENS
jgi:hypothetical protein